jgi:ATP-binding cassette, subfamily B, bacterial
MTGAGQTGWIALRQRRSVQWLIGNLAQRWAGLASVVATMLAGVAVTLLMPWPLKILIDNVLGAEPLPPALAEALGMIGLVPTASVLLAGAVIATVALYFAGWVINLVDAIARINYSQRLVYDLSVHLFDHLQRLSLRFHDRKRVGDLIRRITSDTGFLRTLLQDALLPTGTALFTLAGMFMIMWRMNPVLSLIAVAVVPLMALAFVIYARRMLERSYAQETAEGRIYSAVEQTLTAIPAVQAFAQERRHAETLRTNTATALQAAVAAADVDVRFRIVVGLATALGTAAVLWLGAHQVLQGHLTLGGLLVFLAYQASFYAPLSALMSASSTVQTAAGSAVRVMEILDTDEAVDERADAVTLTQVRGRVQLDGLRFGYEPDKPVLDGVTLTIEPGQTLALVGASGAGKSTLVSLILRLFDPWQGRVLLDGHDIRGVTLDSLRGQIAIVLQEPFLFPLSVADNIAYGRPGAPRAQIEAAARAANAHAFIERLPEGYDTVIAERGAALSGGERQRIAIARALLRNAPILILDEPTSALDAQTEGEVMEALRRLMQGRTTLIIAHRFSTIGAASSIAVLDAGRLTEVGSFETLMAQPDGAFRRLYALQQGAAAAHGPGS